MKIFIINFILLVLTILLSVLVFPISDFVDFQNFGTYTGEALVIGVSGYSVYISIVLEVVYRKKKNIKFSFWNLITLWIISNIILQPIPLYIAGGGSLSILSIPTSLAVLLPYAILRKIFSKL